MSSHITAIFLWVCMVSGSADAYNMPVHLGAVKVSLATQNNVSPLMLQRAIVPVINKPEGAIFLQAEIKALPYIRDAVLKSDREVWVFFISQDLFLAFHHLKKFFHTSERWRHCSGNRAFTLQEYSHEDALTPLLRKTSIM